MFHWLTLKAVLLVIGGPIAALLSELSQKWLKWLDSLQGATGAVVKQAWTFVWSTLIAFLIMQVPNICPGQNAPCLVTEIDFRALLEWGLKIAAGAVAAHGIKKAADRAP